MKSKQEGRAERILEAAAELVLRLNYKKTTIDDIARQAGVAKGTIYLHWKTREELFQTLILREWLLSARETLARILSDPEGIMLHAIIKHSVYVVLSRPLAKALFIRDGDTWGEMIQQISFSEGEPSIYEQRLAMSIRLITLMREKGLLRADLSVQEHLYMM